LVIGRKPSSRENQLNNSNAFRRVEPVKSDSLLAPFSIPRHSRLDGLSAWTTSDISRMRARAEENAREAALECAVLRYAFAFKLFFTILRPQ
jgi:hypothetical protein